MCPTLERTAVLRCASLPLPTSHLLSAIVRLYSCCCLNIAKARPFQFFLLPIQSPLSAQLFPKLVFQFFHLLTTALFVLAPPIFFRMFALFQPCGIFSFTFCLLLLSPPLLFCIFL